ncbi:hypothetical protein HG536_0C03160 [Torulaspora globosa]|uniref:Mitochondrial chaperone TCM62 n=1 Tax=Torulaspora globosa TaxID=48254 RepID=A0A7G3ZF62_9SACH|nr:uncharacterized protein HG536_0C03160 [Torulaspora globosa]QLL32148.1 hypothetical protein HG536_0C03160 [Torulaspora globosa]
MVMSIMVGRGIKRIGCCRAVIRSIKTLHTPVVKTDEPATRVAVLEGIKLLDRVINSTSYNKSLISTGKYRSKPQIITSQNALKLQNVIRELLDSNQLREAMNDPKFLDINEKLGKIGLQLFVDCHDGNIIPMSASLTHILMEQYYKSPCKETLTGIIQSLEQVRTFLRSKKISVQSREEVDALVGKLCQTNKDSETIRKVLYSLDYKLPSPDIVRVVKGQRIEDELAISRGWRFPAGVLDTNDAYLRSLQLPEKKLVSIDKDILVLLYDGTLNDASKILPTLNYAAKNQKSVLVIVTGDCLGDALTSITISNNRNRRQGNNSRTVIMKYDARACSDLSLQENHQLIDFLGLPNGASSIYSPDFSPYVPSTMCADQFYGKLDSFQATTGEAFLHNSGVWGDQDTGNKFLRMTITVKVGGTSELEIDHRRSVLDNIINDTLCHGLSTGFVPAYGIALAKAIPSMTREPELDLKVKLGVDSVVMALAVPMTRAVENLYGLSRFQVTGIVADTLRERNFSRAPLAPDSEALDLLKEGVLEPWNKIDKCLANVSTFIKLLSSCNTIVAQVFEKPKKRE